MHCPAIAGRIFGEGVLATIGNDAETAAALEQTGVKHVECAVDDIVVDDHHKLVTTPAYMTARSISEAARGSTSWLIAFCLWPDFSKPCSPGLGGQVSCTITGCFSKSINSKYALSTRIRDI